MADSKISALTDGGAFQVGDFFVVARSGANNKIAGSEFPLKIYDYTVAGSSKASIDTNVDGTLAGLFSTSFSLLEVWLYVRTDEAVVQSTLSVTFNNDTGNNYDLIRLQALNSTLSGASSNARANWFFLAPGSSCTANVFGAAEISIPNYAGTTGFKTGDIRGWVPDESGVNTAYQLFGCNWRSTSALTRIAVTPATAGKNLVVGSRLMVFAR